MLKALTRLFGFVTPSSRADRHLIKACPDCGVRHGELHELYCTKERCPFCGHQLITCDCIRSVLNLSDAERHALDEYIDDSIPPLSEVMRRWESALACKGRVPFTEFQDDPYRAAHRGDIEAVRRFLEDGLQPDGENDEGYTVLMSAARGSQLGVIRMLLGKGGSVSKTDKRGNSVLHCAVAQPAGAPEEVACVLALLEAGADPNATSLEGGTPLMNAAWFGCDGSVEVLLRRGAKRDTRDRKGRTARDLALLRGHTDIAKLLE